MTDKTMRRSGRAPTIAATPLAAALLVLSCAPAEARWMQNLVQKGGKSWAKHRVESYVKPDAGNALQNLTDRLLDQFSKASVSDGPDWEAVEEIGGRKLIKDAVPILKPVLKLGDAVVAAPELARDMLKSVDRKIRRFVPRTGEAAVDTRAALAIGKSEREYVSGTGLFAREPLPPVRVAAAPTAVAASGGATGGGAADSAAVEYVWNEQGTGVVALPPDWRERRDPWGAAPTAAAASGGATGGGAADSAAVEYVWNEQGTGVVALPPDWRERRDPWGAAPTATAAPGGAAGGGAAVEYVWNEQGTGVVALPPDWRDPKGTAPAAAGPDDAYAAALDAALGGDPTTGSGDYRAALGALETREAERREAERLEAERLEAERVAAARREAEQQERLRAERRRQREEDEREESERLRREAEYARYRQERFVDTMRLISEAWGATLQSYGASQSGGSERGKPRFAPAGNTRGASADCPPPAPGVGYWTCR